MAITRLKDRAAGGSIVADDDDTEFDSIITEVNAHTAGTAAVHGLTGTVVGTSDTQTLTNKTLSGNVGGTPAFTGQYASTANSLTDGATIALDWDDGNVQYVTLEGNRTFTFANPKAGGRYVLLLIQDATGSRTITWPTITWTGGSAPTLTTTAAHVDVLTFVYVGSTYYGTSILDFS